MRQKLIVHVDTQSWFIRPNNTDWRYMKTIKGMETFIPVEFVYPNDSIDSFLESSHYIRSRLGLISLAEAENLIRNVKLRYGSQRPDVVLSHRRLPVDTDGVPCVWQYAVIDPDMQMSAGCDLRHVERQYARIEEALGHAAALQVSTVAEAVRHKQVLPSLTQDIFPVPFFLPHVEAISRAEIRSKHQQDSQIKVLFVGREGRRKGLDIVFGALAGLSESARRLIDLTVVCSFADGAVETPAGVNVQLIKALPASDVQALMRSSHVFIMPSRFESFGFTLVEAMAAGCCVIGPDWEVQKEILDGENAGLNVDARVESVALALERVFDRQLRSNLAEAAVDRFEHVYSARQVSKKYFDMLSSVV